MRKPTERPQTPRSKEELANFVWSLASERNWKNEDVMKGKHDPEIYAYFGVSNKEELFQLIEEHVDSVTRGKWSRTSKSAIAPPPARSRVKAQAEKPSGIDLSTWLNRFAFLAGLGLVGAAIKPHLNLEQPPSAIEVYKESARHITVEADQLGINSISKVEAKRCARKAAFNKFFGFRVNTNSTKIVEACTSNWPKQ